MGRDMFSFMKRFGLLIITNNRYRLEVEMMFFTHTNSSSIAGVNAVKLGLEYDISKAAIDTATKQFALELGPHGIRVNSVNPTGV